MFVLSKKLQILKRNIKAWTKNIFGNVHGQVKKAEKDIGCIQEKIEQDGYNDDLAVKEKETQVKLDLALKTKELLWKEKTIVQWPAECDINIKKNYRVTKIINSTKVIQSMKIG